ncbi:phosphatidylglycerophosphatase A family protein [Pollutimonas harenae]|uniref:Phosphatidylglycerophosphatase A n=1 Tax=Pollutimonas harenae TaxID=657015 RepID=A0A853GP70_9BURK|nr:phosphatidylglycerophosphatase A [Pollutimonas harenae]NYT83977.1 phosphatidylglycerophosphatase A [Pollutimonas harenae]TEA73595.1 phosphatidylglycerophosphatase A [Pollutimonas harenae]
MPAMDPSAINDTKPEPTPSWVFKSVPRVIAFGLGSGLLKPAPGTWGTLMGWLLWVLVIGRLSDTAIAVSIIAAFALGCWVCQRTGVEMGRPDHGGMVWDEIVAFWLVLWLTPDGLIAQLLAFVVFRLFDIIKPPPIHFFDGRFKNGFGVMWDDILAAAYSLLVIAVLVRLEVLP